MRYYPVIDDALELFVRQAEAEEWKSTGDSAQQRTISDLLALGIWIVHRVENTAAGSVAREFDRDEVGAVCAAFKAWLTPAEGLLDEITDLESAGGAVENADEFRAAVGFVRSLPLDVDAIQAINDLAQARGRGTPLGAAMDELRSGTG